MSELNKLRKIIPKITVGAIKFSSSEILPTNSSAKNVEILLPLLQRTVDAGAEGCVFYLLDEEMVKFLNVINTTFPELKIMVLVKFDEIDFISSLLTKLDFKPLVIFLDHTISDQRDNELVSKYINALSKFTDHFGIYTLEPIGTVSFFITSTQNIQIFIVPFNMLGFGLQNRSLVEMIINSSDNLYLAADVLAQGRIKPRQAYDYVTTHRIHGTYIELEEIEAVLESIKFARYFLETHDFLQIALEFEDHSEICENCGLGMSRYYPPTGGSWWYCPQCQAKKEAKNNVK
ncbi:MAG: hypothetical protein ACTSX6_12195 [Candidatus Heimdallarchaeaceae archaeon]